MQPKKTEELEQLDSVYKKTEYNAHKKHHHNIPTMDRFKNLIMGDLAFECRARSNTNVCFEENKYE